MKLKMRGKYGWDQKGSHNLLVIIYWVNTSFLHMWANPSIKEPTENLRIAQKGHGDNTCHLSGGSQSEQSPEWVMLPQTWPCEGLQCPAPQEWTSLSQMRLSAMADFGGLSENSNRVCKKNKHHSFLLQPNIYLLKTAPLQRKTAPTQIGMAPWFSCIPASLIPLCAVTPHPCPTVRNKHFEFLGCCGFSSESPDNLIPAFLCPCFCSSIYSSFLHFPPCPIR